MDLPVLAGRGSYEVGEDIVPLRRSLRSVYIGLFYLAQCRFQLEADVKSFLLLIYKTDLSSLVFLLLLFLLFTLLIHPQDKAAGLKLKDYVNTNTLDDDLRRQMPLRPNHMDSKNPR